MKKRGEREGERHFLSHNHRLCSLRGSQVDGRISEPGRNPRWHRRVRRLSADDAHRCSECARCHKGRKGVPQARLNQGRKRRASCQLVPSSARGGPCSRRRLEKAAGSRSAHLRFNKPQRRLHDRCQCGSTAISQRASSAWPARAFSFCHCAPTEALLLSGFLSETCATPKEARGACATAATATIRPLSFLARLISPETLSTADSFSGNAAISHAGINFPLSLPARWCSKSNSS